MMRPHAGLTDSELDRQPWLRGIYRWWYDLTWSEGATYRWWFASPDDRALHQALFKIFATVTDEGEVGE